jgi:hypothetical protein
MQIEQHFVSEWVHVVMHIKHRIVPVGCQMTKTYMYICNKSQAAIINTVTGVQAEQLMNFGKMIISQQFINPMQMWHSFNIGNGGNESE